jgi:SAM-dependent methyltransferase
VTIDIRAEERAAFWNEKILRWEAARYSPLAFFNPCAWVIRERLRVAAALLAADLSWCRSIVDLGCGSGRLAHAIADDPGRTYLGVDFAGAAIETARARFRAQDPRIRFLCDEFYAALPTVAHLAVFLGLTDWLDDGEIERLFGVVSAKTLLFSFTDAESPFRGVYSRYRRGVDGPFQARSFRQEELAAAARRGGYRVRRVIHSVRLGPGRLMIADRL